MDEFKTSLRVLAFWLGSLALLGTARAQDEPPEPPFWNDQRRGWHFYEEAPREVAMPRPKAVTPSPRSGRPTEVEEFERLQRTLEELRQVAIVRPTEPNVRRYMELEARVVAQASRFADVAQRVAWGTPELDPTLHGRPVNAKAVEVFDQGLSTDRVRAVGALSRDHALIFVFRSDCPYCHAFSPTLDAFRRRHGLQVLAVSLDGGVLPEFAHARRDNGIAAALRVSQVPAVFLARPATGQITPIGFGVLSESQLLERIATAASGPIDPRATTTTLATSLERDPP